MTGSYKKSLSHLIQRTLSMHGSVNALIRHLNKPRVNIHEMVENPAGEWTTPLVTAIQFKCDALIYELLVRNADVHFFRNAQHQTPLLIACNKYCSFITIRLLVEYAGADVHAVDENRINCLMMSVDHLNAKACIYFLKYCRMNPNHVDVHGNTALHHAMMAYSRSDLNKKFFIPTVKTLLKYNADPMLVNNQGFDAIDQAVLHNCYDEIRDCIPRDLRQIRDQLYSCKHIPSGYCLHECEQKEYDLNLSEFSESSDSESSDMDNDDGMGWNTVESDENSIYYEEDEEEIEEKREDKQALKCKICFQRDSNVVFVPCNHLLCCTKCYEYLTQCPMCRAPILHSLKIYIC